MRIIYAHFVPRLTLCEIQGSVARKAHYAERGLLFYINVEQSYEHIERRKERA